jgi:methionyl-tRNA formyltransferase
MVIVFFGTPQFAVPTLQRLLESRHRVCGVVTQPDRPRGRGQKLTEAPVKALAVQRGLPVIQPERLKDPSLADTLRGWRPDIGVVVAYGRIIPESLLEIPRFGMINVHASILPKYRGAAPIHRAVIDGEVQTGVTIMRVARLLDSGDMFATATRPIRPDETSEEVERDLSEVGAALLLQVLDAIESGAAVEEQQDHTLATYAPKITREDGLIDWCLPAQAIHNRVRGLYPWPHAFTYLDGSRLIILRTRLQQGPPSTSARSAPADQEGGHHDSPTEAGHYEPGTVVEVSRDAIHVATGDGGRIAIEELQPEGKRPMRVRDYLAGRPLDAGARFTATGGPDQARPTT